CRLTGGDARGEREGEDQRARPLTELPPSEDRSHGHVFPIDCLLDKLDAALDLLRCHRLNPSRMLNSKISRAQQCQQLAVSCRLVLAHLGNCRWTAVPEVSQQRRDELAIQLLAMTRADRTASRISWGGATGLSPIMTATALLAVTDRARTKPSSAMCRGS